ncbi:MAG TPA: hypothetical protein VH108_04590 [Gaiellaceae bacterium]|jgi:hypothetical protein|nr:hypothetical protein [Gaiellaceae bacterium]
MSQGYPLAIAVAALLAIETAAGAARADGQAPQPPASNFSSRVDNPWFPLHPGTRYVYTGVKDGTPSRDVVTVTHETKTIEGVPCGAVQDRLYLRGHLEERTTDWYSQDKPGNVWYFGENTAELDRHGHVTSTAGTWTAGVDGAEAGIYMPARPRLGQSGRQEFYRGQAEDHFQVIGVFGQNAVLTKEWTPLEPGTIDHKLYVRGIGTVLEQTQRGGNERNELISVTSGG